MQNIMDLKCKGSWWNFACVRLAWRSILCQLTSLHRKNMFLQDLWAPSSIDVPENRLRTIEDLLRCDLNCPNKTKNTTCNSNEWMCLYISQMMEPPDGAKCANFSTDIFGNYDFSQNDMPPLPTLEAGHVVKVSLVMCRIRLNTWLAVIGFRGSVWFWHALVNSPRLDFRAGLACQTCLLIKPKILPAFDSCQLLTLEVIFLLFGIKILWKR